MEHAMVIVTPLRRSVVWMVLSQEVGMFQYLGFCQPKLLPHWQKRSCFGSVGFFVCSLATLFTQNIKYGLQLNSTEGSWLGKGTGD